MAAGTTNVHLPVTGPEPLRPVSPWTPRRLTRSLVGSQRSGLGVSPEDICVLPASLDSVSRAPAGVLATACPHLAQGLNRKKRGCCLCRVKNTVGGSRASLLQKQLRPRRSSGVSKAYYGPETGLRAGCPPAASWEIRSFPKDSVPSLQTRGAPRSLTSPRAPLHLHPRPATLPRPLHPAPREPGPVCAWPFCTLVRSPGRSPSLPRCLGCLPFALHGSARRGCFLSR